MKSRFEIKANAEQLIKTNNLWITIGLIPTLVSLLTITTQFSENTTVTQFSLPLSIMVSFFEVGSMLYVYDVINERKEIQQGFTNQFKDIINSITQKSFIVYLLVTLYTILWAIIPLAGIFIAIIKGYVYGLAIYLAKDNDQLGYNDTITKSRTLMNGRKQDRFILSLSFIPWILLSFVTFGLANIYVIPYMLAADAIYAKEVIKNQN
jgi:integral membrane protein